MTATFPLPEPTPEEVSRGLAELERHLRDQAQPAPATVPAPVDVPPAATEPAAGPSETGGQTKRVRRLRDEVAEAHLLADLQEDEAPLLVDTPKVRKRRKRAAEAARLHELASDPAAVAYRDAKVRRTVTVMVMLAACIALLVSSIGVQASVAAALDLAPHTLGWWAAFGVEPALSLPLLAAVAVQAYSAMRGLVVDRKSPEGRKLFRTEALLLGLTLVLNCWPALAGGFDALSLIVHSLGPVAAVTAIWVLPALWSVLAALPVLKTTDASTAATYSVNAASVAPLVARARRLIEDGMLPERPSASRLQRTLRCGMDAARAVRDALAEGAS
ncbi:hypothetical protein GCM10010149_23700 [Nonomuraea roseoviolacea subsp. roseoviolacea]|uniref:DUF2637 domain-containing protein n=1 Tax=Nonomuraea roseoviolacea subsp. carminata TaxID=160689 RepID=A0ABT1JS41_9ACTN|nr:hypothetical protein [Nonomuraea roseoviolacea]MCP2344540.1 hypothetical protein [Nonomuraea roseoviolacea subsp. carminata]